MKKTQKCKRILAIIAAFMMLSCISACSSQETSKPQTEHQEVSGIQSELPETPETPKAGQAAEPVGFDSPQNAVKAYLEGLKSSDFKRMADTFAEEMYLDDILRQYTVLCQLELNPDSSIQLKEEGDAKQFMKKLTGQIKAVDLESMKLLGFMPSEMYPDIYNSETNKKNMVKRAEKFGGDNIESCAALIGLGKNKYVLFFEVIEIDNQWYNLELGGLLANMADVDREAAGTALLDKERGQVFKKLITDSSKDLFQSGTEVPVAEESTEIIFESEGFDSPQLAAKAYLEGFKAHELDKMLSAFSIESYVDHYDLQASLENVHAYVFMHQEFNLPAVNDFSRGFNIQSRKEEIIRDTVKQYAAVCITNEGYFKNSTLLEDEDISDENISSKLKELLNQLDLSSMKILGYIPPEELSETYGSDGRLDITAQQIKICGADNVESGVAIFELEGNKYCFCFDAVQYKDKWYIRRLGGSISTLLDIPSDFAGITPIDALEKPEAEKLIIPIT
ncbi:hypothetical protein ABFV83_04385 [Lacrimispora sp. BS-2]|uniref:Uncharacterized protein n=1 Tax=Lacrimispora sp. BS-2 TaxID=3151850 RepID=A0AAU7PRP8_9FIRM